MTLGYRRALGLAVASLAVAFASGAHAGEALHIAHGKDISPANTGPQAAGYVSLIPYPGAAIRDGRSYPFAREIASAATYDGFEISGPHVLIEGAAFTSALDIYTTKPVVLRGVSMRPSAAAPFALMTRPGAGPVYVLWSEAGGTATLDRAHAVGAAIVLRSDNAIVFRSHVSQSGDGIDIAASHISVDENLVDALTSFEGDHNDGIQLMGAPEHVAIARNKILNHNPQTSCIYVLGAHIDVRSNYLAGGGWTLYGGGKNNGHGGGAASHVSVTDTVFGPDYFSKSGSFGAVAYWDTTTAGSSWSDNRFGDGTPIQP